MNKKSKRLRQETPTANPDFLSADHTHIDDVVADIGGRAARSSGGDLLMGGVLLIIFLPTTLMGQTRSAYPDQIALEVRDLADDGDVAGSLMDYVIFDDDVIMPPESGLRQGVCGTSLNCGTDVFGRIQSYIPTANTPIKTICVNFHIFQSSNGTGNWQDCPSDRADLQQIVGWMNNYLSMYQCIPSDPCPGVTYLTDTKIRVSLENIWFYQDTTAWSTSGNKQAIVNIVESAAFSVHPTARQQLNVYFTGGTYGGASGFAAFPSTDRNYDQYIVMLNNTTSNCDGQYLNYAASNTLTHELGHVLALHHTYDSDTCDPSNCQYLSDVFCPPVNPCYQQGGWSCDPFVPPGVNSCTNNMMGSTGDACIFSPLQIGKMHRALSITSAQKYVKPSACMPAPGNMVLWLPFNETSGSVSLNAAGGKRGNHVNGPTISAGKVGNSLCFNGTNQYVDVSSYDAINLGSDDLTIETWIMRSPGGEGVILDKRRESNPTRGYHLILINGVLTLQLADGTGYSNYVGTSAATVPSSGWHHIAVTVDRDTPVGGKFYLDGNQVGPTFDPTLRQGSLSSTYPLRVGARSSSTDGFFAGCIDELAVYRRALNPEEIRAIYDAGTAGRCQRACKIPWDSPFCSGDDAIDVTAQICNASTFPETFMYWFEGLSSDSGCSVDGPIDFTPCSGLITIPSGSCTPVAVEIARPTDMNVTNETGCYQLNVQSLGTNNPGKFSCNGSVQDRRDWCSTFPFSVLRGDIGVALAIGPVSVTNTGVSSAILNYRFEVIADDMNLDQEAVSLNGTAPGTPVTGVLNLAAGASADIDLTAQFVAYQPLRFYTVLLSADTNNDGFLDPLGSAALQNVIPRPCESPADPPTAVAASDATSSVYVTVTWNAPATVANEYEIWRSAGNTIGTAILIGTASRSPFRDTTAAPGRYYNYWVRHVNDCGLASPFAGPDRGIRRMYPAPPRP